MLSRLGLKCIHPYSRCSFSEPEECCCHSCKFFYHKTLGSCSSAYKRLTYAYTVTGKCGKDGRCQEFSTKQYSAPICIYDVVCR